MDMVIQADWDTLLSVASSFKQAAEQTTALDRRLLKQIQRVETSWEGQGAEAFSAEMHQAVLPALARLINALLQAHTTSLQIVQLLQEAEREAAGLFRGEGDPPTPTGTPTPTPSEPPSGTPSPAAAPTVPPATGTPTPTPTPSIESSGSFGASAQDNPGLIRYTAAPTPLSPEAQRAVDTLTAITLIADLSVTLISGTAAGVFWTTVAAAGATGSTSLVGSMMEVVSYPALNQVENLISIVGFGATLTSDVIQHNTWISFGDQSHPAYIEIGQDTFFSAAGLLIGNSPLGGEPTVDTAVNSFLSYYDMRGATGNPVIFGDHRWKFHMGADGVYFIGYPPPSGLSILP